MTYILSSLIPSPADDRDFPFVPHLGPYKDAIDFRPQASPVDDQGQQGSCTAESVVNGCERFSIANGIPFLDLSRQFNYYNSRKMDGQLGSEGANLRTAVHSTYRHGLPPESEWPYDPANENTEPSPSVYASALLRRVSRYERIDMSGEWQAKTQQLWAALDEGLSVEIAMHVGQQIYAISGFLGDQHYSPVGPGNPFIGNHAMWLAGKLPSQYGSFFTKNSWGNAWGDQGYFEIGQTILTDVFEAWAIRGFAGADPTTTAKHAWAIANPAIVAQYVNANMANPQIIIDGAIEYALTAAELEAIMLWPVGAVLNYSQNDPVGKTLDWRGFVF